MERLNSNQKNTSVLKFSGERTKLTNAIKTTETIKAATQERERNIPDLEGLQRSLDVLTDKLQGNFEALTNILHTLASSPNDALIISVVTAITGGIANMKESSVCGRIRELIDANLVEEVGTTKNRMGTKAATLALKEKFYQ